MEYWRDSAMHIFHIPRLQDLNPKPLEVLCVT
jgi:hypothetical protein